MKKSNLFIVLIVLGSFVITGCDDDNQLPINQQSDNLEQYNILGEWKMETRLIDNVTDAAVPCCDYITFSTDDTEDDLEGNFTAISTSNETNGTFVLNPAENTIKFSYNEDTLVYDYQINGTALSFYYVESSSNIEELWRKQ